MSLIKNLFWFFFLFVNLNIYSQSIQRYVFSSSGSIGNEGALTIESNIGELISDTYSDSAIIMSQGFVQPEASVLTLVESQTDISGVYVFPNPFISSLFIQAEIEKAGDLEIEACDVLGHNILIEKPEYVTKSVYELNVEKWLPGIYFIRIKSPANPVNRVIKVIKL
jgi:hypothetical protein